MLLNKCSLHDAISALRSGKVIAFPTETVYGLGAAITQPEAIEEIFKVKGRPSDNPLIVHLGYLDQVQEIAQDIPLSFYSLYDAFMPGPLTVVLKKKEGLSDQITRGLPTVALRFPRHKIAQEILKGLHIPLVAPSANVSGKPSPTQAQHVFDDFGMQIAGIVEGGTCEVGLESTVVSLVDPLKPLLLRPGIITKEQLEEVLELPVESAGEKTPVLSPGMKYRHYAPQAEVFLVEEAPQEEGLYLEEGVTAHNLYSILRQSDQDNIKRIFIRRTEKVIEDAALMNRLSKIIN